MHWGAQKEEVSLYPPKPFSLYKKKQQTPLQISASHEPTNHLHWKNPAVYLKGEKKNSSVTS